MEMFDENLGRIRLVNKRFEDMTLEELYTERGVHQWHRSKVRWLIERLKKRRWWLEQNQPILSKEEITAKYENGEMTLGQYKTAFASRKNAIDHRAHLEQRVTYADRVAYDEEALVLYLDELIAQKMSSKPQTSSERGWKRDPRKKVTPSNRRRWEATIDMNQMPKLKEARKRWKAYKANDLDAINTSYTFQPISQWDAEKLRHIARDRGYFTDAAVTAVIANAFGISTLATTKLMNSGRLSWGQCAVIGAIFEMTPREFCDVFMSGYFREVADGVYHAYIEDIPEFVANLQAKQRRRASVSEKITESEAEDGEE